VKHTSTGSKFVPYDHPLPRPQPIPIPNKHHAPRVPSGLAITVPKTLDLWESGSPRSFPQGYDVSMGSRSTSPMATAEQQSIRDRSTPSQAPEFRAKDTSPSRQYSYKEERREHERDPVDHRRVQLHDLLDSQTSASLPTNAQLQSILSSESKPVHNRSYSMQSLSHPPLPRNPSPPNQNQGTSAKPSPSSSFSQNHGSLHSAYTSRTPLPMSHASSAAMQLERIRAEKERENNRERDLQRQATPSSSLRDTTNSRQRMGSIGNGKAKMQVYA